MQLRDTTLVQVEQAEKLKDERIKQLEQTIHTLQHDFQEVAALLRLKPTVRQVEAAVERKRKDQ